jgi:hypothetical protein
MISLNKTQLAPALSGKARRMAASIGLALLASNIAAVSALHDLAPTIWALTIVLAPVAILAGLAPQSAFVPPVVIEANVIYRPLPEKKVRYWLLLIPGTWFLASPLALLTGGSGLFVTIGVALMSAFVCLDVLARAQLEDVSFSVGEGGVYCASTMRRPLPWTAIQRVREVGRGDDSALVIDCRRPTDYVRPWRALFPGKTVRLSLADMSSDERRLVADRIRRRLERPA